MKLRKWDQMTEDQRVAFTAGMKAKLRSNSKRARLAVVRSLSKAFDRPLFALTAFIMHEAGCDQ